MGRCLVVGCAAAVVLLGLDRIVNLLNTAFFTLGLALLVLVAAGMIRRGKMKKVDDNDQ